MNHEGFSMSEPEIDAPNEISEATSTLEMDTSGVGVFVPEAQQEEFTQLSEQAKAALDAAEMRRDDAARLNSYSRNSAKFARAASGIAVTGAGLGAVTAGPGGAMVGGAVGAIGVAAGMGISGVTKVLSMNAERSADKHEANAAAAYGETREIVTDELVRTGATIEDGKLDATAAQIELARREMENALANRNKSE